MPNLNVEKTTTLSNNLMTYLEKRFLDRLLVKFHFGKFGMKQKLRKGHGKVVDWVRYTNLSDSTTALTESVSPDGLDVANTKITATVAGYGQYASTSDFLVLTGITDIMKDSIKKCRIRLLKADNTEITEKHIIAVLKNIVWINLKHHPTGSLEYDFEFNNSPKKETIEKWLKWSKGELDESKLPVDEEIFSVYSHRH